MESRFLPVYKIPHIKNKKIQNCRKLKERYGKINMERVREREREREKRKEKPTYHV